MKNITISRGDKSLVNCDECEIDFKSEYHLDNHMKSSEHSIKAGIKRKFDYKLNKKNTRTKLLKGASKNPLVKEMNN